MILPKLYPPKGSPAPKAAFPEGRPRRTHALSPKHTPAAITLLQLQRRVVQAGPNGAEGMEATQEAAAGTIIARVEAQSVEGQERGRRAKEGK